MKYNITSEYFDKGNRSFAIIYINNIIVESEEHYKAVKQYFLNGYNISDASRIDEIMDNKDKNIKLNNYAMVSKKDNNIVILYDSIENIEISDLYKKLKREYPKHKISFNSDWYKDEELKEMIN